MSDSIHVEMLQKLTKVIKCKITLHSLHCVKYILIIIKAAKVI